MAQSFRKKVFQSKRKKSLAFFGEPIILKPDSFDYLKVGCH